MRRRSGLVIVYVSIGMWAVGAVPTDYLPDKQTPAADAAKAEEGMVSPQAEANNLESTSPEGAEDGQQSRQRRSRTKTKKKAVKPHTICSHHGAHRRCLPRARERGAAFPHCKAS